jgi:hypothetical protein
VLTYLPPSLPSQIRLALKQHPEIGPSIVDTKHFMLPAVFDRIIVQKWQKIRVVNQTVVARRLVPNTEEKT